MHESRETSECLLEMNVSKISANILYKKKWEYLFVQKYEIFFKRIIIICILNLLI